MISPKTFSSDADSVPQKPQISACLAGFHVASAPHAGQAYFELAVISRPTMADDYDFKNSSRDVARVMRNCVPIFLALRSPA